MPASSKKRKTADDDTIDIDVDADESPPNLPSACLANALNFSEHSTVRQCMTAGKTMAVDAAKEMETLNIMCPSEMVVTAVRDRFPNVKVINVLCLVSQHPDDEEMQVLSAEAVTRVLPLMMAFPKLEKVYLGGMARDNSDGTLKREEYNHEYCARPEDHREIFRSFVESLCGAFESRSLPQGLELGGLDFASQLNCWPKLMRDRTRWMWKRESSQHWVCRCCRRIIKSLPLELILDREIGCLSDDIAVCMPMSHRLEIFISREDAVDFLQSTKGKNHVIKYILGGMFCQYSFDRNSPAMEEFGERMLGHGASESSAGIVDVTFLSQRSVHSLRRAIHMMIPHGQPGFIPPNFFGASLPWYLRPGTYSSKRILLRETFQVLVDLGFQLDARNYIIVGLHEEPALEPLRGIVG